MPLTEGEGERKSVGTGISSFFTNIFQSFSSKETSSLFSAHRPANSTRACLLRHCRKICHLCLWQGEGKLRKKSLKRSIPFKISTSDPIISGPSLILLLSSTFKQDKCVFYLQNIPIPCWSMGLVLSPFQLTEWQLFWTWRTMGSTEDFHGHYSEESQEDWPLAGIKSCNRSLGPTAQGTPSQPDVHQARAGVPTAGPAMQMHSPSALSHCSGNIKPPQN